MKSGIYRIINKITKDIYIGSALNLNKRKYNHFDSLKRNKHHSLHLQRAVNKYGIDMFEFEIVCYCDSNNLLKFEQKCLDVYKPTYNINKKTFSRIGMKASKETIEKLKISHLGQKAWNKGLKPKSLQGIHSGENSVNSKLTLEQIKEIRQRATFEKQKDLAKEFGVKPMAICKIVNFITWKE